MWQYYYCIQNRYAIPDILFHDIPPSFLLSLLFRVLGSIASIISERKSVHHSIHTGLDSHDKVEMEAAIYAVSSFAAESKAFANGICNKLADLIQGIFVALIEPEA